MISNSFLALSMNATIKRYIEYYDQLMTNLEKKRAFKFNKNKALELQSCDNVLRIASENIKDDEKDMEVRIDLAKLIDRGDGDENEEKGREIEQ